MKAKLVLQDHLTRWHSTWCTWKIIHVSNVACIQRAPWDSSSKEEIPGILENWNASYLNKVTNWNTILCIFSIYLISQLQTSFEQFPLHLEQILLQELVASILPQKSHRTNQAEKKWQQHFVDPTPNLKINGVQWQFCIGDHWWDLPRKLHYSGSLLRLLSLTRFV